MILSSLFSKLFIGCIRFYQRYVSIIFPGSCRFYPTCSNYSIEAIKKFGPFQGLLMSVYRILRCGPWTNGGYDPPEKPLINFKKRGKNGK